MWYISVLQSLFPLKCCGAFIVFYSVGVVLGQNLPMSCLSVCLGLHEWPVFREPLRRTSFTPAPPPFTPQRVDAAEGERLKKLKTLKGQ